jgi:hypothetical protein
VFVGKDTQDSIILPDCAWFLGFRHPMGLRPRSGEFLLGVAAREKIEIRFPIGRSPGILSMDGWIPVPAGKIQA